MQLSMWTKTVRAALVAGCAAACGLTAAQITIDAAGQTPAAQRAQAGCKVAGKITSGTKPLPGVSLIIRQGEIVVGATSTDAQGTYQFTLAPSAAYRMTAEFTAFSPADREITLGALPCEWKGDIELTLLSRAPKSPESPAPPAAAAPAPSATAPKPTGAPATIPTSSGGAPGQAGRFQALDVQTDQTAAAGLQANPPDPSDATTRLLLPPGFSTDGPTQAVAVNGNMASIDRGGLNDRMQALNRGEIDPVTGELTQSGFGDGFGAPGGRGGPGGFGGPGVAGGRGGPGGPGGAGGRGGPGGRGGFAIGGRGQQQRLYQFTSNYSYGGSVLDAAPYQLRSDTATNKKPYNKNNFGFTVGGPVKIPGVYNGQNKTNFQFSYSGNRSSDLFDQYATVPTDAIRNGDFSSLAFQLIDPATGQPFPGNQIPFGALSPTSLALLRFVPEPNLPGDTRNFHDSTTTNTTSDNINIRITHSLVGQGRGGGGRGGGGGGRGGGGRGGRQGLSVNVNAQVQYRRSESDQANVFPTLGGQSRSSSLTLPVGLNISKGRNQHAFNVNFTRSVSQSRNNFAYAENVAGLAGIAGVSNDPFDWGVPSLNFSTYTDLRDVSPSRRTDKRLSLTYAWTRPAGAHTFRMGGDFRQDWSATQTDSNPNGSFVFTGLYASGGSSVVRTGGLDFADFLLGLPQQATIQFGPGNVQTKGKSFSAYFQDDWRYRGNLTFSLGVRYELVMPYVETNGQMVNLDVNNTFTAAVPVVSGGTGPFNGAYPAALIRPDWNNVAPRVGLAWRARPGLIVRSGYGVSYNAGSYASIARQLVAQPPFATTNTSIGTALSPLYLTDPFVTASPTTTTNNYGVDPNYKLGVVQTWNVDVSKDLRQVWNVGVGYTGTKGSSLDMVRAPNRGPSGLVIPDVQAFTWQTSEAHSILQAATFRIQRRAARGIGGGVTYTLARSMDNASTLGGGRTTVAQNDRDLAAEWGLSSFDRRHQISANMNVELPFGPNRKWLSGGGFFSTLLEGWRVNSTFTWQSGTPYTATVTGAAADVAQGTNGTLRANYNGEPIQISNPTIDQFFNTSAFTSPTPGTFGNSARNLIIGPGSKQLNMNLARDVRLGNARSNRTMSIQLTATNLLNLVNYAGLNTNVNSPTFGQITSVRGMRTMQLNFRFRF
jgi:trimeric autotransporter adhesin